MLVDFFRYQKLGFVQEAGNRTAGIEQLGNGLPNRFVIASKDCRTARLQEINILVAVLVIEVCTRSL